MIIRALNKKILYIKCLDFVEQRISHAQVALDLATEAGNNEDKSSAGDKHETGRAMAQIDQENARKQLHEAYELKNSLLRINPELNSTKAVAGSIVITDKNMFYIAVAAGKIEIDGTTVFVLSPISPIGQKLLRLSEGEQMEYNGQVYKIKEVQ
jgi:transcription elongation GreA/GreB family factor